MAKLNLGCGPDWKKNYPAFEGLDIHDYGQRFVGDVIRLLPEIIKTGEKFDGLMAQHFMEHFDQEEVRVILNNCHKLLAPNATFKIIVPHKDRDEAWVLSHKTFWNESTFTWLTKDDTESVYGFKQWKILDLVINSRKDIHVLLCPA